MRAAYSRIRREHRLSVLEQPEEYVLVPQDKAKMRNYRRLSHGWELKTYREGEPLRVGSVNLSIVTEGRVRRPKTRVISGLPHVPPRFLSIRNPSPVSGNQVIAAGC